MDDNNQNIDLGEFNRYIHEVMENDQPALDDSPIQSNPIQSNPIQSNPIQKIILI